MSGRQTGGMEPVGGKANAVLRPRDADGWKFGESSAGDACC